MEDRSTPMRLTAWDRFLHGLVSVDDEESSRDISRCWNEGMDSIGRCCCSMLEVPVLGMAGSDMGLLLSDESMVDDDDNDEEEKEEGLDDDDNVFSTVVSMRIAASSSNSVLPDDCLVFFV
mmetsp:Transcript_7710/g.16078  ORF Transcript_7710/g.16078 Transcript_7710/m.16078 type:complete len:121 (+) Transcript_7710:770-1132(+)